MLNHIPSPLKPTFDIFNLYDLYDILNYEKSNFDVFKYEGHVDCANELCVKYRNDTYDGMKECEEDDCEEDDCEEDDCEEETHEEECEDDTYEEDIPPTPIKTPQQEEPKLDSNYGKKSIVTFDEFLTLFHKKTNNLFMDFNWDSVVLSGGFLFGLLDNLSTNSLLPGLDIDLFVYGTGPIKKRK